MSFCPLTINEFDTNKVTFNKPEKKIISGVQYLISSISYDSSKNNGFLLQTPKLPVHRITENFLEVLLNQKQKHKLFYRAISGLEKHALSETARCSFEWFPKNLSYEEIVSMFKSSVVNPGTMDDPFVFRVRLDPTVELEDPGVPVSIVFLLKVDSLVFSKTSCFIDMKVVKTQFAKLESIMPIQEFSSVGQEGSFFEHIENSNIELPVSETEHESKDLVKEYEQEPEQVLEQEQEFKEPVLEQVLEEVLEQQEPVLEEVLEQEPVLEQEKEILEQEKEILEQEPVLKEILEQEPVLKEVLEQEKEVLEQQEPVLEEPVLEEEPILEEKEINFEKEEKVLQEYPIGSLVLSKSNNSGLYSISKIIDFNGNSYDVVYEDGSLYKIPAYNIKKMPDFTKKQEKQEKSRDVFVEGLLDYKKDREQEKLEKLEKLERKKRKEQKRKEIERQKEIEREERETETEKEERKYMKKYKKIKNDSEEDEEDYQEQKWKPIPIHPDEVSDNPIDVLKKRIQKSIKENDIETALKLGEILKLYK